MPEALQYCIEHQVIFREVMQQDDAPLSEYSSCIDHDLICTQKETIVPFHKDFPPSGEQPEQRIITHKV